MRNEIRERTIGYIAAAFSVVAGLAWNDAIKGIIEYAFPLPANSLPAKVIYALAISIVAVVITSYLVRLIMPPEKK